MGEKMRIVLNANYDHPSNQGGVSTFNRNIIKILDNYNLRVLCYTGKKKKIYKVDIDKVIEIYNFSRIIKSIDARIFKYKLQKFIVKRNIKKLNPNICIINSFEDIKLLENLKIKKIMVQHTDFKIYWNKFFYKQEGDFLKKLINEIDCLVCLSEYSKKSFINKLKFPEEKIKVIRHTSDIDNLISKKEKNRTLIMLTRLSSEKRIELVIKAMKKLPEYELNIYGAGEKKVELEKLIKKEELKNVKLCGITNRIKEKLDKSGIFIMTSDFEGYPISAIEAMRRGLPIILRDTFDSAKDIIQGNGVLLDEKWNENNFVEAVKEIYKNYEEFSKKSKKLGERYNFDKIKKEWINLMMELEK